jgi:conjugative relaxase-like TrwC/TraI family protein
MLRIIQSQNVAAAKTYYTQGLSKEDYYSESQEIVGAWGGKGAKILLLDGDVGKSDFEALCDNLHPLTNERLTARMSQERRVGYDLNFHCPKSVSAVFALTKDEAIMQSFREAVRETMQEIEADMQTRVRTQEQYKDRNTNNLIWAEFVHLTARPVNNIPDPHLHAHCFTFNATFDSIEGKWKAGQFGNIKRDAPFYEATFHARLAGKLSTLGYGIQRNAKSWELASVPLSVIDKFSRRTAEIEAIAKQKNITDAKAKDALAAKTRASKRKGVGFDDLRREWKERLTTNELKAVFDAKGRGGSAYISPTRAVDYAMTNAFERSSVISDKRLMASALRFGVGSVSVEAVKNQMKRSDIITKEFDGRRLTTTKRVLNEEKTMLAIAKDGRGKYSPLGSEKYQFERDFLSGEQKAAVVHVLRSNDRVIGIRGGAGVGKTSLMAETVRGIEQKGKKVFAFAPTAQAARDVLRAEGFTKADTVASFLHNKSLQDAVKGQVIWIDEAGLLGSKTMVEVLRIAKENDARVILSGDVRQHSSVERGDALRVLENQGVIKTAYIGSIQRQKGEYKEAVESISKGNIAKGFDDLDKLGWIVEQTGNRYGDLARDYVDFAKKGKTALAISPTHKEGEKVTEAIRGELRNEKLLHGREREVLQLRNLSLTEAEKSNSTNYQKGLAVQFVQNAKGFRVGERVNVCEIAADGSVLVADDSKRVRSLPLDQSKYFQVYEKDKVALAVGDKLRITQNGYSLPDKENQNKRYLSNGSIYEVSGFTKSGDIQLNNGSVIAKNYGNLSYGYCTTSHAAQGKTVDRVLIAQSADSFAASSKEQFYVSVSRGRESAKIYTDDKQALKEAVKDSSTRLSATELMQKKSDNSFAQKIQQHAETVNRLASLAKTYAARAVDSAKDWVTKQDKSWSNVVKSQKDKGEEYER